MQPDRWAARAVVVIIGAVAMIFAVAAMVLTFGAKPDTATLTIVVGVVTTCLGVLVPSPLSKAQTPVADVAEVDPVIDDGVDYSK